MNDNSDPQQPPDGLPDEFNPDIAVDVWSQAMVLLVREVRTLRAEVRTLRAQNIVQQGLLDNLNNRVQRLEGSHTPPVVGNA